MKLRSIVLSSCASLLLLGAAPTQAATINWVQWSDAFTTGASGGSGSGTISTLPSVNVGYSGELETIEFGYPSWGPSSTFDASGMGAPPPAGGIVQLFGGQSVVDTITFSAPVTDPYIAIWSLGQGTIDASFYFDAAPTFDSGGPSNEYSGAAITVLGDVVSGQEGNGVIHFSGTYNSISWYNPVYENWYGFSVGIADVATPVPEPVTLSLVGGGLIAGATILRRRKAKRT